MKSYRCKCPVSENLCDKGIYAKQKRWGVSDVPSLYRSADAIPFSGFYYSSSPYRLINTFFMSVADAM